MYYPNFNAAKFVAIFIYIYIYILGILFRMISLYKKNKFSAITPPKQVQTLLYYQS